MSGRLGLTQSTLKQRTSSVAPGIPAPNRALVDPPDKPPAGACHGYLHSTAEQHLEVVSPRTTVAKALALAPPVHVVDRTDRGAGLLYAARELAGWAPAAAAMANTPAYAAREEEARQRERESQAPRLITELAPCSCQRCGSRFANDGHPVLQSSGKPLHEHALPACCAAGR